MIIVIIVNVTLCAAVLLLSTDVIRLKHRLARIEALIRRSRRPRP